MRVQGTKSDVTVLLILLVASLGGNLFLARAWHGATHPPAVTALAAGQAVPTLDLKSLDGRAAAIAYAGESRATIVYAFTPTCSWCRKNIENVRHLWTQKGREFRFVGVSLERAGTEAYVARHHLPFPVYTDPSEATLAAYHLNSGVPRTIVVSSEGKVLHDWSGAYAAGNDKAIADFFQVKFPGLVEPESNDAVRVSAR
jgi:peroxiredoxin